MAELTENLIRLRSVNGVGNTLIWRLLRRFGDSERVLHAPVSELRQVKGITQSLAEAIVRAATFDPRPEMERAVEVDADIIPYDDPVYPKALLYSYEPPVLLYVKGTLVRDDNIAVGIVGTREASPYGRDNALQLGAALARGGFTIVSGLALGVDTFAHIGAMNGGGRTIGVLGCGFDHMYPEQNRDLAIEMSRNGAVITEYSMATRPSRETFPMRNRIIAGMSYGLLVIEAPLRSGSLITARLANEYGRTVFAIPGRVDDIRSEGCNKLIRDGAVIVTSVEDIFRELNPSLPEEMYMKERPPRTAKAKPKPPENEPPGRRPRIRERAVPATPPPRPSDSLFSRDPEDVKDTLDWVMDRNLLAEPSDAQYGEPDTRRNTAEREPPRETPRQPSRTTPGKTPGKTSRKDSAGESGPRPAVDETETAILRVLSRDWRVIDDIIAECGLDSGKVTACLAMLRMKRLVEQGPGQAYRLRS